MFTKLAGFRFRIHFLGYGSIALNGLAPKGVSKAWLFKLKRVSKQRLSGPAFKSL